MDYELSLNNLSLKQIDILIEQILSIVSEEEKNNFIKELQYIDVQYTKDIDHIVNNKFKDIY
jgi:hypothetical protein